jgi:hypothetical protein
VSTASTSSCAFLARSAERRTSRARHLLKYVRPTMTETLSFSKSYPRRVDINRCLVDCGNQTPFFHHVESQKGSYCWSLRFQMRHTQLEAIFRSQGQTNRTSLVTCWYDTWCVNTHRQPCLIAMYYLFKSAEQNGEKDYELIITVESLNDT